MPNIVPIAISMMVSATSSFQSMASVANDEWALLRNSGTVVLMRHAIAPGTGDPEEFRIDDCSTQRNLSEEGREQAREIGRAFRRRGIRVSQVLSSQWCRCLETARLMNLGDVKPQPALNSFFRDRSTDDSQTAQTRRLIVEHRPKSGVTVMVTHQVNITSLTGIVPRSGGIVVVRADDEGEVKVLGEL